MSEKLRCHNCGEEIYQGDTYLKHGNECYCNNCYEGWNYMQYQVKNGDYIGDENDCSEETYNEIITKGTKVRVKHGDYAGVVGTIEEIDNHGGYSLIAVSEDSPRMANEKYIWAITDFLEEVK